MVSNGRKFRDMNFARSLYEKGLHSATFSIEGSCREIHDSTTKIPGSFDEVIQGVKNAASLGIHLHSNTVISTRNISDLEKAIDSLSGLGLEGMSFNINGICISDDSNNEYMVHPREAVAAFEKAYVHAKSKGIAARLVTPVPLCYFSPSLLPELEKNRAIGSTPCQLVHGRNFVIDYNGDIVPCTHLTGFQMFNIFRDGQVVNREEFIKRYNSETPATFREKMGRYASSKCEGCEENCSGGCPLFWIKYNPETEIAGQSRMLERVK